MDVLSASYDDDKIAWYENDGTGNFGAQQVITSAADGASSVYAQDIDGDGDIDVLSASFADDKIAWYENDGLGNFGAQQVITTAADGAQSVYAQDLDGDGDMDVLSASKWDNKIAWCENDGTGNFGAQQVITSAAEYANSVYAQDIDGDGDMDVLSASRNDDKIAWYQNDGSGNFGAQQVITSAAEYANSVYAQDIDGDGDMDVLSASSGDDKIAWYENDGTGNFGAQQVITTAADSAQSVYAQDLDGDGDMDILSASFIDGKIAWYENDGTGNFGAQQVITSAADYAGSVYAQDLDGDGDIDVLSASRDDDKIAWYENDGSGNFGDQLVITIAGYGANSVYAQDLDGDGDMDVLSASRYDDKIAYYENDGSGNFGSQQVITTSANSADSVYAQDLDGDGDMDVLSASFIDDKIAWYENDGSGNFGTQQVISTSAYGAKSVYAQDLDEDGDIDVLSASFWDDKIAWYENDGSGNFGTQQVITTAADCAYSVYTQDLDGDGDMDVLSASEHDDKIAWYENDGYGNFGDQQVISTAANGAKSVYAQDLDGDGDMDVLSASSFDDKIAWYENDGTGNFGAQQVITSAADYANSVYAQDLDGDGDIDVLSASWYDDKIAWYENDGAGNFGAQQIISSNVYGAHSVYAQDLDGDGDMDVLSASHNDEKIAWYENLTGQGCIDIEACNYDNNAWIENGSCCYTECGCTDPIAENYLDTANCENGSCEYIEGCSNDLAINYNPEVTLNDGTCQFKITGTVFFDENENATMDGEEYGLPFQNVFIEALGMSFITNDQGGFIANIGNEQLATFELSENPVFPVNTTPNPITFDAETSESTQLMFGISNEEPDFEVCIDLYPSGNGFLCNDYANHNMCFRNMGNVPIDGVLELEYDELFQGHQEVTPIDSVNGNTVYMSFENLLPGEMFFYDIDLLTPTVDHIGEYISSYARVYGYYLGDQVAYGEQELTMEIACAYDPNDKQAFPLGYTDEHWLLPETEQEFLVRFQNTGNAPAQDVRIQDTIDVNYDLSTFRFVANSHSVMTTINEETRVIDFFFEDIQLPDSVNNEPESHGLVSYAITPYAGLEVGTELNNTAYIYFDNNEAIVTNTTWTTIHECGGEAGFEASVTEICLGEQVNFTSTYAEVETHQWNIDAVPENTEAAFSKTFTETGEYIVQLVAENPLCNASTMQMITVYENPSSEFSASAAEICAGEAIALTGTGDNAASYAWWIDQEMVGDAQSITVEFEEAGEYIVELNTENVICSDSQSEMITVFQTPTVTFSQEGDLLTSSEGDAYQWFLNGEEIASATNQEYAITEDGTYSVSVTNENNCTALSEGIMIVGISELTAETILLYPNPMTNEATLQFSDQQVRNIMLTDAQGKVIKEWTNSNKEQITIKRSDLPAGNYMIKVVQNDSLSTLKLIIQ